MAPRLVPLQAGTASPIPLHRPVLLVGRHPECDVRIDLPQVSRRHCCLALAYDRATIRDLGSRHGVRVNGRVVEEARLLPGDEVAIGHLIYRFEEAEVAPPAPPKPKPRPAPREDISLPQLNVNLRDLKEDDLFPMDD
jgi:pSer/pThr/pTyr-binding forkhead associated (FHA) protein